MASLKGMSEENKLNHIANLFAVITKRDVKVTHLVMSPEDWVLARDIPNIFSPESNKKRFDKGCCAWTMGAYVWIDKGAKDMKAYGEDTFAELEKDYPKLAKSIKELEKTGEIV